MKFSWIDLLILLFVLRGVVVGHKRGFATEVMRFLGVIVGLFLAFKFREGVAGKLADRFALSEAVSSGCAFVLVFLIVIAVFYILSRVVRHLMELPLIATLERLGGAFLGGCKALLCAAVIMVLLALVKVDSIAGAVRHRSLFGSYAISAAPGVYRFVVRVFPAARSEEVTRALTSLSEEKESGEETVGEDGAGQGDMATLDFVMP